MNYAVLSAIALLLSAAGSPSFAQTIGTPSPTSPPNGATNQPTSLTLTWSVVSLATSYEVQVSTVNTFASLLVNRVQSGTSYTVSGLSQGDTYYWRVRASTLVLTGNWSSTWSFATTTGASAPSAPTLVTPVNGATGQAASITFGWNASTGASSYNLQVATDNTFANIIANKSGIAGTSQQVSGLASSTTYYWRVEAVNSTGTSPWSSTWSFGTAAGASAPSAPSLVSPANGATGQPTSVSFSWGASSGASSYNLQVATNNGFTHVVSNTTGISGTSQQVGGLANGTTYYWRVEAVNSVGTSPWSSTWSFGTAAPPSAPSLVSPANGATGQPTSVSFSWGTSSGASSYNLQIATDNGFTHVVSNTSGISGTSQQVGGLVNGTIYYWRVAAVNSAGTSPWSSTRSFGTAAVPSAPTLVTPANGASGQSASITFGWNASTGASTYNLQVATDNTFANIIANKSGIAGTSQQVTGMASSTTYYWRVEAVNSTDTSAWSSVWKFTTSSSATPPPTPLLASPSNGATKEPTTLVVNWNASTGASTYNLQVAIDNTFTNVIANKSGIAGTSQQITGMASSTTYYWRVEAVNSTGTSAWSSTWSFGTAAAPSAPSLASPANGASGQSTSITFSWNASTGASSYNLQVATDKAFSSIVVGDSSITATSQQVNYLNPSTTYYWRVMALNSAGASSWSSAWSFSTASTPVPPPPPALLSPANGATNQSDSLTFTWAGAAGAADYRLQVALSGSFSSPIIDDSTLTDTAMYVTSLISGDEYFWRVQAVDAAGPGSWSSTWSFGTGSQTPAPAVPTLLSPLNKAAGLLTTDTLRWSPSQNAASYKLQVSASSGFASLTVNDSGMMQTSRIVTGLSSGTSYYWRVEAVNSASASGWSDAWTFATAGPSNSPSVPLLLSPLNEATEQTFVDTLKWNPVQYAQSYQVLFSTYPSLDSAVVRDSTTSSKFLVVIGLRTYTQYFWRVRALDSAGASSWSTEWSFTTMTATSAPPVPVLMSPLNGATEQPVVDQLSWKGSPYAQHYTLQLSSNSTFTGTLVLDTTGAETSVSTGALSLEKTYWWKVRAENNSGNSQWSAIWSFSTSKAPSPGPKAVTPANGASGLPTTVVFSWEGIPGTEFYDVQVATDSGFYSLVLDDSSMSSAFFTSPPLKYGTLYYWHVRAESQSGVWTGFSQTWDFSTGTRVNTAGDVAVGIDVDYPADGTTLTPSDYRLVGFPGAGNIPVTSIFPGTAGKTWEAYWDNGAPSNYLVKFDPAKKDSTFRFSLGRAFWTIKQGPLVVDTTVAAAPLDSAGAAPIPLHGGWNLITDPFSDSVSWGAVQSSNYTAEPLYTFRGAFQTATELQPGRGYYFFNSRNMKELLVPFPANSPSMSSIAMPAAGAAADDWTLNITLTSDGVTDNAAWLGASSAVDHEFNKLDVRKPAGLGSVPVTYFSHPDWDKHYSEFASEIHPDFTDFSEWTLRVDSQPFRNATLNFAGLDQVPANFDVYVFNPVTKSWLNLRKSPKLDFTPVSQTTALQIMIGKHDIIKNKIVRIMPVSIDLGPNYPNPFNPTTTIPIFLPADSRVIVTVFNVIGQKVNRIFDGELKSGSHLFQWDGRDENGRQAPSGVYFYRATTGTGASVVRKMVLLK